MKIRIAFLIALFMFAAPVFLPYAEEAKVNLFSQGDKGLKINEILNFFKESNPNIKILEGRLETARA